MPDNLFDTLPAEVKLHLFSFLSIKDTANVLKTNRTNRSINHDDDFWRHKVWQDFYVSAPDDYDANAYYQELHERLGREQKVFVAFLRALLTISAYSNMVGMDADEEVRFKINIDIQKLYSEFNYQHVPVFLNFANELAEKYIHLGAPADCSTKAITCYQSLVAARPAEVTANITMAMACPLFQTIHKVRLRELTPDVINVVGMHALINSGAHASFRVMLNKLNPELRKQLLQQCGASLLCDAVVYGESECAQVLLGLGVDVNEASYVLTFGDSDIYKPPLAMALKAMCHQDFFAANNNSLDAMKRMVILLLESGADPDLPGYNQHHGERRPVSAYSAITECHTVQFWIHHPDHDARFATTSTQRGVVNEILQLVRAASKLEQAWVLQQQNRPQFG